MKSDFFPCVSKTRGQSLGLKSYVCAYGTKKSFLNLSQSFEFEKKALRKSWKLNFGHGLPESVVCASNLDASPNQTVISKQNFNLNRNDFQTKPLKITKTLLTDQNQNLLSQSSKPCFCSPHFLCASWLLDHLTEQVAKKQNVRGVINDLLRQASSIMRNQQSGSNLCGLRLVASGRLSRRKKAMSQQISRSLGVVPLSSLSAKVDYDCGHVTTKLGTIGFKVWLTYS